MLETEPPKWNIILAAPDHDFEPLSGHHIPRRREISLGILVLNVIFIRTKEFSNHFQEWHNPYLMWNGSNFGGINAINVDAKKVWKPDIFLYNK